MARLLLVRHGITEFNSTRRLAGYSDVELSAEGYEQVARLRDRLAGEKIDAVYSSDLKRTLATAGVITAGRELDIIPCSELREINYGIAEGLTFQELGERYPAVAELVSNFSLQLQFPGGETFTEFISRAISFLDRLDGHDTEQTILIVTHGGTLRTLVCDLLGLEQDHWRKFRFDNASLSIVERHSPRAVLSLLNDTSHLK